MNKRGFSLIELVIAMAVGSVILFAVYQTFNQIQKAALRLDAVLIKDTMIMPLYNQLEKDISAIYVPVPLPAGPAPAQVAPVQASPAKPEEKKELEKIFYTTSKDSGLQELTFITTTPLVGYDEVAPRLVRVTYALKQEPDNVYTLTRTESSQLAYKPEKATPTKSYDIAQGIKKITLTLYVFSEQKKDEKTEYKTVSEWSSEEQFKKIKKHVPDYISLTITWHDAVLRKERNFIIELPIIAQERIAEEKPAGAGPTPTEQAPKLPQKPLGS
ncbi:MAG: prepilin-type N-terminal cleavage/methylation domain-containing protein [Candidatus Babeliaceae bacterium]